MEEYRKRIYDHYSSLMCGRVTISEAKEREVYHRSYDKLLKGWLPESTETIILDVGCGKGNLLKFLKEEGFRNLRGVDISPEQVELSRKVVGGVEEGDAVQYLSNCKESVGAIIGLDIIEHMHKEDVIPFIEGCYGALRNNGRLILQTPNAESPWGMGIVKSDFTHEVSFTPHSLCKLLELCGFERIEIRGMDPVVHGILSMGRFVIWKMIWLVLATWNLAETGRLGYGIYSRVFLISGIKRAKE